jgi:hypothetical protein
MTDNVISYTVSEVVYEEWIIDKEDNYWGGKFVKYITKDLKVPCIVIFGPSQQIRFAFLKKKLPKKYKIIFESKKAVNNREGHEDPKQRNTLVVIDKCED